MWKYEACYNARNKNKSGAVFQNVSVSSILNGVDISGYHDIQDVSESHKSTESRMKEQFVNDMKLEEKREKGKDGLWK